MSHYKIAGRAVGSTLFYTISQEKLEFVIVPNHHAIRARLCFKHQGKN